MVFEIPSIFDLKEDEQRTLRMPFNPADYGDGNIILRPCNECGEMFPQGIMKELGAHDDDPDGIEGTGKLWNRSLFYCEGCWFSSDISDAGRWVA